MALLGTVLDGITSSDYQSHVLLCDHAPHIRPRVFFGTLASDNFAIIQIAKRPIDEVGINVASDLLVIVFAAFTILDISWH